MKYRYNEFIVSFYADELLMSAHGEIMIFKNIILQNRRNKNFQSYRIILDIMEQIPLGLQ